MIEENATKEEMHQRVEDLHDILFDLIENKRDEMLEERRNIMISGFLELEMESFLGNVYIFLQAELQRAFRCIQLLTDYYSLLDKKDLIDIPEYYNKTLPTNYETLPLESTSNEDPNQNTFPKLDRMISDSLRLFAGEEEEALQQQAGKKGAPVKGAPSPKKEDPKKKKGAKDAPEEEKKEETKWELELRKAINVEKAVFRYRVNVIKNSCLSR